METLTSFELLKNNILTNMADWLQDMSLLTYGRVTNVLDVQTVEIEEVIKSDVDIARYIITLLCPSSKYKEEVVSPVVGDLVLILFLQK